MLIIEALERYDYFYGDALLVECPTGSGNKMRLKDVSVELSRRLGSLFVKDNMGKRACHGDEARYIDDNHWNDLVLFYEFFDAENGRGCGARYVFGYFLSLNIMRLSLLPWVGLFEKRRFSMLTVNIA